MSSGFTFAASGLERAVADHLWQSTAFAGLAGLLVLALRPARASIRYWVWIAASIKFLLPFVLLVNVGTYIGARIFSAVNLAPAEAGILIQTIGQPFSGTAAPSSGLAASSTQPVDGSAVGRLAIVSIWVVGSTAVFARWWTRWRRLRTAVRAGSLVRLGREVDILRRLGGDGRFRRPIAVVASTSSFEPGVFGIFKPRLLWPKRINDRLDEAHVEAILDHEVWHVRRLDNLTAAVHMIVQGLFWFHPLVWWLGARLVDERERACDEEVVRHREPLVYAESILRTCQFCVESSLACVSGVTGGDLKKRIERIMKNPASGNLNAWRRALVVFAGVTALAWPIIVGAINAPGGQEQATEGARTERPTFEVASVKQNKSGSGMVQIGLQPGGTFTATNVPLRMLIRNAYRLQDFQISGGPNWINEDRFDVIAKAEAGGGDDLFTGAQREEPTRLQLMMQALLADRFKLVVHNEDRELPIYALQLARRDKKLGPQLRPSSTDCAAARGQSRGGAAQPGTADAMQCGIRVGPGNIAAGGIALSQLASTLSIFAGRTVFDRTGLTGTFDVQLEWTPDQMPGRGFGGGPGGPPAGLPPGVPPPPPIDPNGPSIFTAVQEQLGLKLESQKGPVRVVVVDQAEHPTED